MGRTELGADRKWDEVAWGEPALGRNVWHPGFEELSPADLASLENSVDELRSPKGELYKKTTSLTYRQEIQRYLQTYCPTIVTDFIESNRLFKGTRKTRISTFTFHIVYVCAVCLFQVYMYAVF